MKRHVWKLGAFLLLALLIGGCGPAAAPTAVPAPVPLSEKAYPEGGAAREAGTGADMLAVVSATTMERMVIHRATLDLIVPDTRKALSEIEKLAGELGGYVTSLNTYRYERGETASVTLRIPADQLDAALERLRGLATTVQRESISGEDITEEFVDLESRLRHLEAKEAQLLEFLKKAEDTEAVLAVYQHLSETQAEIEQVKGRMRFLQNQVAMATVTVNLTPDEMAQPLETGGWNLPRTVRTAVQLLLNVLEFLVKALVYLLIVVFPTLLFLALFAWGMLVLARALVRWGLRRRK